MSRAVVVALNGPVTGEAIGAARAARRGMVLRYPPGNLHRVQAAMRHAAIGIVDYEIATGLGCPRPPLVICISRCQFRRTRAMMRSGDSLVFLDTDAAHRRLAFDLALSGLTVFPKGLWNENLEVSQLTRCFAQLAMEELDILTELTKGHTKKSIADTLGKSPERIKYLTDRIYSKLDASNRTQAVRIGAGRFGAFLHQTPRCVSSGSDR